MAKKAEIIEPILDEIKQEVEPVEQETVSDEAVVS